MKFCFTDASSSLPNARSHTATKRSRNSNTRTAFALCRVTAMMYKFSWRTCKYDVFPTVITGARTSGFVMTWTRKASVIERLHTSAPHIAVHEPVPQVMPVEPADDCLPFLREYEDGLLVRIRSYARSCLTDSMSAGSRPLAKRARLRPRTSARLCPPYLAARPPAVLPQRWRVSAK